MRSVPLDPALPGLAELFPAAGVPTFVLQMAEATGLALNGAGGKLSYVRYKPAKDCVAQWSFSTAAGRPLFVSAKLFRDGKGGEIAGSQSFRRLADQARSVTNLASSPYRYLPEQRILLQLFPMDTRLPGAVLAACETWASETFSRSSGFGRGEIHVSDAIPLRYKAWHRLVLCYTVEHERQQLRYFGKVFRDDRGKAMFIRLRALKAQLEASGSPWEIPSPVMYIPAARMLVLGDLGKGGEIKDLLKDSVGNRSSKRTIDLNVGRAAEGLALFQRAELPGLPVVTPQMLLEWLGRRMKRIASVAPALAESIADQLRDLEVEASRLAPEPIVPTHGAFRHTQMVACGDRLGLFDWDGLRLSGASADAGEFLSCLDRMSLRRSRFRSVLQHVEEAFVAALERQTSLDARWLRWHRALENIKWALRSFSSFATKGGEDTTQQLISLAQRTLANGAARRRSRS